MVKFLICTSNIIDAELIARGLADKKIITNRKEWKWIPNNRHFRDYATGWYKYVLHDEVIVLGDISKETFLKRYIRGY